MIPYPSTETVLAKHGNTAAGRDPARKAMVSAIRTQGDELIDAFFARPRPVEPFNIQEQP